jgi:hypothetical protein
MVTAVESRNFAIVPAVSATAESVFTALVCARGFADVVSDVAGSIPRFWEEI